MLHVACKFDAASVAVSPPRLRAAEKKAEVFFVSLLLASAYSHGFLPSSECVVSQGRLNLPESNCKRKHGVYTELICSITGAHSVLNNLCDRELLVGGTIIQEGHTSISETLASSKQQQQLAPAPAAAAAGAATIDFQHVANQTLSLVDHLLSHTNLSQFHSFPDS
uniref:Uncharacterized protein n=1 Tax=Vespula pensylvanica TaxID=30213 RepID=A0A834PC55_VESPE|nr:hypothetical protein H0235_003606 [Vespula pensylvanica]